MKASPKKPKAKPIANCIVCGTEFVLTRSDRQTCSRKCGTRHQHAKANDPTRHDLITHYLLDEVAPEDDLLHTGDTGTHLFDETITKREPVDFYWLDWPKKSHLTSLVHTKKGRIIEAAQSFIATEKRMTLRHLHYLLVSAHITENTQSDYKYISEVLTEARERGEIPYSAIRDGVRNSITFNTWESPAEFAVSVADAYRKDIWKSQRDAVEIWFEKDSVVGVVEDIAREYCVTMRPLRGQASATFLFENATDISSVNKNLYIYYFGDHDPSGYVIEASARERLIHLLLDEFEWTTTDVVNKLRWRRLGFLEDDFHTFEVVALDAKPSDTNYKTFTRRYGTDAAELEALPPHELRKRVTDAIESHLDMAEWQRLKAIEQAERESWLNAVTQTKQCTGIPS